MTIYSTLIETIDGSNGFMGWLNDAHPDVPPNQYEPVDGTAGQAGADASYLNDGALPSGDPPPLDWDILVSAGNGGDGGDGGREYFGNEIDGIRAHTGNGGGGANGGNGNLELTSFIYDASGADESVAINASISGGSGGSGGAHIVQLVNDGYFEGHSGDAGSGGSGHGVIHDAVFDYTQLQGAFGDLAISENVYGGDAGYAWGGYTTTGDSAVSDGAHAGNGGNGGNADATISNITYRAGYDDINFGSVVSLTANATPGNSSIALAISEPWDKNGIGGTASAYVQDNNVIFSGGNDTLSLHAETFVNAGHYGFGVTTISTNVVSMAGGTDSVLIDLIGTGSLKFSGNIIDGGAGIDSLIVRIIGWDVAPYTGGGSVVLDLANGILSLGDEVDTITGFENAYVGVGQFHSSTLVQEDADINLIGTAAANGLATGTGNDTVSAGGGNDTIDLGGGDDWADGGDGADSILGDGGNDFLLGGPSSDCLLGGEGNDMLDGGTGSDSLNGEAGDDTLFGGDRWDTLIGGDGNDVLDGGLDNDQMYGGYGNDTYYVDKFGDRTYELADQGNDTVYSSISLTLGANVETLILAGSSGLSGTGNALANMIVGNSGNNVLSGLDGADSLSGNDGNDTLLGGARWDTLVGGAGDDSLDGGVDNDQMYGGTGNDSYVVDNTGDRTYENAGEGNDTVFSSITWSLSSEIEALVLTGSGNINGTGNGLANMITGNGGANTLSGGAGADTIDGGLGADSLDGGIGNDVLLGGARWDTLVGGDGNDTLDGGLDNDQMYGGLGNDVYYVDNVGDRVYENVSEGIDTVYASISWDMTSNTEVVILTGTGNSSSTGNSLANTMTGNSGNNTLVGGVSNDTISGFDGDDSIDGGIDSDQLDGGNGNDTLLGGQRWDTLTGGAGDDVLDGGTENDRMTGGTGNDTYYVDNVGDRVYENANEGTDTVYSMIDFALGPDIENLILQGTAISGTGNGLNNKITGNSQANTLSGGNGNDTLTGGLGNDLLTGGTGRDDFVFSSPASNGTDHITDFVHLTDRLVFTGSDYGIAPGHALTTAEFTVGTSAIGTGAQFIWDPTSHHLYFDADGTGAGTAIDLALIDNGATLAKEDLFFT